MILPISIILIIVWTVGGENNSYSPVKNKTKRTLSQHLINYDNYESRHMPIYAETSLPQVFSGNDFRSLKSEYKPALPVGLPHELKLLHSQYSPQQILYEVPSVVSPRNRVHQILQPVVNRDQIENYKDQRLPTGSNVPNYMQTETVVLPVDNKYRDTRYNIFPLRKQVHANEKTNYEVYNIAPTSPYNSPYVNQFMYQQQVSKVPLLSNQHNLHIQNSQSAPTLNYINRSHGPRRLNYNIPKYNSPATSNINNPSNKKPKSYSQLKRDENIEHKEENEEETRKIEENDSEEKSTHEEQEENSEKQPDDFGESDHFDYGNDKDTTEEEYDQDSKRGSTKYISSKKYPRKQSKNEKFNGNNYYKYRNNDYNREHSEHKPTKKNSKTPKMIYKSIKFSKEINEPDDDSIEGKQSENIPVTRKHRLIREKWYISKNKDETEKE